MFSKKEELKGLINKEILSLEKSKEEIKEYNEDLLELYNELEKDINRIVYLNKEDIKEIVDKLDIDNKDKLFEELETIKNILIMNKDYKSTLRLFKKNKDSYKYFIEKFNELNNTLKDNDPSINKINDKINDYNALISNIESNDYEISNKDLTLYEELFTNNTDKDSQSILLELINYENRTYRNKLNKSVEKDKEKLNEEDIIKLLDKYNYNYSDIEDKYKEYLITNGNLDNINEVLISLEENNYPKINDNYVLVSLLLGSSKETINEVTKFAKENKLIPDTLLDISGAIITQNNIDKTDDYSIMIKGSSLDFMRNIMTLKNDGISINYIYQGCKSILTMPNELLVKNLDLFNKYGFSFDYKRRGIIDPSPAALLSTDFASIADKFIEIHEDGLKYLTDNLSNLKTVSNKDSLLFYNIYESAKEYKGNIDDPEDGPFRKVMEEGKENLQLKAIITRNNKKYRNTYYKGINKDNKKEITNTIDINFKDKDKYDNIIKNTKDLQISNSIFNNAYIQSINKYIDYDSALIYNFKGIRISRLKVLRIYNTLIKSGIKDSFDSLMYAITYNTIISRENYDKLSKCIKKEIEVR